VQELQTLAIPADRNVIAEYPIAPLAESANLALANGFIDYVLSAEGQATLETWGFTPIIP
jgi:molybdate transport system substrate-binding protein